jgi:predicted flap endonuclease-1-like 5' DNA nuclease
MFEDKSMLKLVHKLGIGEGLAQELVKRGYCTPVQLRQADSSELKKIPGVGPMTVAKLKGK